MIDWTQVISQAPSVGVIAFLVIKFLGHLEKRDKLLVTIADRCHSTTDRATEAITELRIAMNGGGKRPGG